MKRYSQTLVGMKSPNIRTFGNSVWFLSLCKQLLYWASAERVSIAAPTVCCDAILGSQQSLGFSVYTLGIMILRHLHRALSHPRDPEVVCRAVWGLWWLWCGCWCARGWKDVSWLHTPNKTPGLHLLNRLFSGPTECQWLLVVKIQCGS